jgi:hypothetical protein
MGGVSPMMQATLKLHKGGFFCYRMRAIHSTEIRIPPGKGSTWGTLRAGGFSEKNSPYTFIKGFVCLVRGALFYQIFILWSSDL